MKNRTITLLCAATIAAVQIVHAANVTVINTNDSGAGSLRQAIIDANPNDTVVFDASVTGTITLTSGELFVNKNLTITGPGANVLSVSGNNASRVVHIGLGNVVTMSDLTIRNGNAPSGQGGGGIYNEQGTLTMSSCTISNNFAGYGGGFYNAGISGFGGATLTLRDCAVTGNWANSIVGGAGGGIYNEATAGNATVTVTNCTLSGNVAGSGGAIENVSTSDPAVVTITHSTLSGNSSRGGPAGGILNRNFGFMGLASLSLTLGNTILQAGAFGANISETCFDDPSCDPTVTSLGYNLSSDAAGGDGTTAPGGFLNAAGDQRNTNPKLGPLQNNGGPTLTNALLGGSPAINAGDPSFTPSAFTPALNFDQRGSGFPRVVSGRIDIGAVEARFVVTNINDAGAGSLRQALIDVGDGEIVFAPGVTGTITLSSGELLVNKNTVISGPGANVLSVSGNNASRVFHIAPGRIVAISGLTIQNGNAAGNNGGGIYNDRSSLTVDSCTLSNNSANNGGAAINDGGSGNATMTLANCTLNANQASAGGALYNVVPGGGGQAILTVVNSTLSGNTADAAGGIANVASSGTASLTVSNSTLSGNSAFFGGGIYNLAQSQGVNAQVSIGDTILKTGAAGGNILNEGGVVTSLGYNLSNDNGVTNVDPGTGSLNAIGDQINTDPILGPLKNNNGPTLTHAPLSNSPAIDRGKDINATGRDQRGSLRPVTYNDPSIVPPAGGDRSDIGAVELPPGVQPGNAASHKTHGGAGDKAINLPLTGNPGIECRSGGATNVYQVILNFAAPVSFSAPAVVTSGSGSVASSTGNGTNQITLNLSGVNNAQTITLGLFGVSDGVNGGDVGIRMGMLLGDTSGNGTVNSTDVSETKLRSGQVVGAANFRSDVNASGAINATDVSTVKLKSGSSLP